MTIDLNADFGESYGRWQLGDDAGLARVVTSVNVACGYHAGDPCSIRDALRLAGEAGVAVGAHPSYPDLAGFGRRDMQLAPDEIEALVTYQVAALVGMARAEGLRVSHVKPHGALYNAAARDGLVARAVARAVRRLDPALILVGLSGSALIDAGRDEQLGVAREAFADRAYLPDGSLAPRSLPGAVLLDAAQVAVRAVRLVTAGTVDAIDGGAAVAVHVDTLCIHGDTPGAVTVARAVRTALEAAGVRLAPLARPA